MIIQECGIMTNNLFVYHITLKSYYGNDFTITAPQPFILPSIALPLLPTTSLSLPRIIGPHPNPVL